MSVKTTLCVSPQEVGNGTVQEKACDLGPGLRPALASLLPIRGLLQTRASAGPGKEKREHPEATAKGNEAQRQRKEVFSDSRGEGKEVPVARLAHRELLTQDCNPHGKDTTVQNTEI